MPRCSHNAHADHIHECCAELVEAKRLLDPAVVEAARYLLRNADTHPHTCCVKCAAAITEAEAEMARLKVALAAAEKLMAPD